MGNFLKIYFWQLISLLFNFASIFVVIPYFSSNPVLYGIYTLVISASIFLSYADFGFLGAGMKFASECVARNDLKQEIKIIGFTGFIFLIFVCLYGLILFWLSLNPGLLIKNLHNVEEKDIASQLLLILAVFSPVFVVQRMLQIIFAIRLKDYIFQRILICSNAVKIVFAIWLFTPDTYPIVVYFLFSQLCSVAAVVAGLLVAKKKLGYDNILLFKSLKFSKELYNKTKSLAFVSIFLTICWILHYELDPFVISKLLGPKSLAVFAIGFILMEYFRAIFGIIFSPFIAKFNHFVGIKDFEGLKKFFHKVLIMALPLTVFPVICIFITMKNLIFIWVGSQYIDSIPIAQILVLSFVFSFISSPTGILVMAYERVRLLYITSALLPVIYWVGVFVTFKFIGLQSFADFKFIALFITAIVYLIIATNLLNMKFWPFVWKLLSPGIFPVLFIVSVVWLSKSFLPLDKQKVNLLFYIAYNGIVIAGATIIYYFSSPVFKNSVNQIITVGFTKVNKHR